MTEIIKIMQILGTIAFALSGSLIGIGSGLDFFGVIFVASVTSFGGGMLRDTLFGINPPSIFTNLPIFFIALSVAILTFLIAYVFRQKFIAFKPKIVYINNIFDAIGLSAFVVTGCEVGCAKGFSDNGFVVIISGLITGVGGGIIRDVLIDTTPYIFKKRVYAMATIVGGAVYFVLRKYTDNIKLASMLAMITVFMMRMLATKYRWSLPRVEIDDKKEDTDSRI